MSRRNSRQSNSSSGSRSSRRTTNPNIFSDDYALEPLDSQGNSPLDVDDESTPTSTTPLVPTSTNTSQNTNNEHTTASSITNPSIYKPPRRRDVGSPAPVRMASSSSNTFSDVHRASSTSSHFSVPRALSPYVGATGPSQPYGMYPQITRTSSIASASTVRPVERPFVAPAGPEHPYSMYPQNTVPEEDDASLAQANIPLGFPGMGEQYQRGAQPRRDDIADIVGSDGHIEELPPYTRYADAQTPKEAPASMAGVVAPAAVAPEISLSPHMSPTQSMHNPVESNVSPSQTARSDSSGSFKEKLRRKSRQKVCGGLPFWIILVIIGVLFLGVILGSIIGAVIGTRKAEMADGDARSYQEPSYVGMRPHDLALITDDDTASLLPR